MSFFKKKKKNVNVIFRRDLPLNFFFLLNYGSCQDLIDSHQTLFSQQSTDAITQSGAWTSALGWAGQRRMGTATVNLSWLLA